MYIHVYTTMLHAKCGRYVCTHAILTHAYCLSSTKSSDDGSSCKSCRIGDVISHSI